MGAELFVPDATRPASPTASAHAAQSILEAEVQGRSTLPIPLAGAAERLLGLAGLRLGDTLPRPLPSVVAHAIQREGATDETAWTVAAALAGGGAKPFPGRPSANAGAALGALLVRGASATEVPLHGKVADSPLEITAMPQGTAGICITAGAGKADPVLESGLRLADEAKDAGGVALAGIRAELPPGRTVAEALATCGRRVAGFTQAWEGRPPPAQAGGGQDGDDEEAERRIPAHGTRE